MSCVAAPQPCWPTKIAKKAWCCQHAGKGCPVTTGGCVTDPYDCNVSPARFVLAHPCARKSGEAKSCWRVMTGPARAPYVLQGVSIGHQSIVDRLPSAQAGFANWQAGWSARSLDGALRQRSDGWVAQSSSSLVQRQCGSWPCEILALQQRSLVSRAKVQKKAWCCKHTGKGCPPAAGGCA